MEFNSFANLSNINIVHEGALTKEILTQDCLKFLAVLHRLHNKTRLDLLQARKEKAKLLDNNMQMVFPVETNSVRENLSWQVDQNIPAQLQRRWVEITGPPSKKGCVNALNSGADVWMSDFEDALGPTWENLLNGQKYLNLANKRELNFVENNKEYKLNDSIATLIVRPRGWHLFEKNIIIDGEPMSGSLFDFGVYYFHNVYLRLERKMGGVFYYLPKLEAYQEASLWNDVFNTAEKYMKVPKGTIRCTVLIETIGAAMEMEEILFELRDYIVALNAGRWDYIFSIIKKLKNNPNAVLPNRGQITMTAKFMRAYTDRIVQVCHKRGAHAIGGMSAFIPSKTDKSINENAFKKTREVIDGFDGSWVAHPDLVKIARDVFEKHLKGKQHQKEVLRKDVNVSSIDLLNLNIPGGNKIFLLVGVITEGGVRSNVNVCIQYIYYWLLGVGAVGLHNLMEDAAGQLWQWRKYGCKTNLGTLISDSYIRTIKNEEMKALEKTLTNKIALNKASEITDLLIFEENFEEFLTLPAYDSMLNLNKPKL